MSVPVRVRFAPSPTGYLHIGGLRTALFNWLFARHNNGIFLVRIEDTDAQRNKAEYVDALFAALAWAGMESDETILFQSQRLEIYNEHAERLIARGLAYRCSCTDDEIEARVRVAGDMQEFYHYDGYCKLNRYEGARPTAIRFAVQDDAQLLSFDDAIRGTVSVEASQIEDFVIVRSDGLPTYNFAVVIDDAASSITHVIRGEDHVSNTPKQLLLYQAFGYKMPTFAHIPMILGPDGSKLSKRNAAVDVLEYKRAGYLKDALLNYVARLGWAHGDQEIFSMYELISAFTLEAVGKKAAIFDVAKLQWLNGVYMRESTAQNLAHEARECGYPFESVCTEWSLEQLYKAINLYKDRVKTIRELYDVLFAVYRGPSVYDKADVDAVVRPQVDLLGTFIATLEQQNSFDHAHLAVVTKEFCKLHDIKLPSIAQPVRLALTGTLSSPGVFEMLELIGKEESLRRFSRLFATL